MTIPSAANDLDRLVTEQVAAEILTVHRATLRRMRRRGDGPKWVRIGPRRIAYPLRMLMEFAYRALTDDAADGNSAKKIRDIS